MNQGREDLDLQVEGEQFVWQLHRLASAARRIAAAGGEPLLGEVEVQRQGNHPWRQPGEDALLNNVEEREDSQDPAVQLPAVIEVDSSTWSSRDISTDSKRGGPLPPRRRAIPKRRAGGRARLQLLAAARRAAAAQARRVRQAEQAQARELRRQRRAQRIQEQLWQRRLLREEGARAPRRRVRRGGGRGSDLPTRS